MIYMIYIYSWSIYLIKKSLTTLQQKSNPSGFGPPNILSVSRFRSILPRLTVYTSKPAIQAQAVGRGIIMGQPASSTSRNLARKYF